MIAALEEAAPIAISAREYEELPDELRKRVEVVDGYAHVSPSPTAIHQRIVLRLATILAAACPPGMECFIGLDVRLCDDPLHVRIPDLVVVRGEVQSVLRPNQVVLAIEIVSPSTVTVDRIHKRQEYLQAGIEDYWLVDWSGDRVSLEIFHDGALYAVFEGGEADVIHPFPLTVNLSLLNV